MNPFGGLGPSPLRLDPLRSSNDWFLTISQSLFKIEANRHIKPCLLQRLLEIYFGPNHIPKQ
jgi:hypothetical protein